MKETHAINQSDTGASHCKLYALKVVFSDNYFDFSDLHVDSSDNCVVICMALTRQEHVLKIYFLTNE